LSGEDLFITGIRKSLEPLSSTYTFFVANFEDLVENIYLY